MDEATSSDARHDEFLRLFSCHSQRIYEFILTLVMRRADAEEIFQDTCLILWKKFDSYDPAGNFHAWACRIAYLDVLQLRRTNRRCRRLARKPWALLADVSWPIRTTWDGGKSARGMFGKAELARS
jgi:DNA-directed RNA polymerase specialized sigma24 family protein